MVARPTPEQRAQMAAFIDAKQPGLLDDLGIPREAACACGHPASEHGQTFGGRCYYEGRDGRCGCDELHLS